MTRVFNGERTFLSPVLRPVETGLYRIGGVDATREQPWLTYTISHAAVSCWPAFVILYALDAFAGGSCRSTPPDISAVAPDLAF